METSTAGGASASSEAASSSSSSGPSTSASAPASATHYLAKRVLRGSAVLHVAEGFFRSPDSADVVLAKETSLELVAVGDDGVLQSICEQDMFGIVKDIGVLQWHSRHVGLIPQIEHKDLLVVLSDSGKLSLLYFCPEMHRFFAIANIELSKPGNLRHQLGRVLAIDRESSFVAVSAYEDKFALIHVSVCQSLHGSGRGTISDKKYFYPPENEEDERTVSVGPLSHLVELHIRDLENVPCSSFASKAKLSEKVSLRYLRLTCDSRYVQDEEGIFEGKQRLIEEVLDELCPPPCLLNLPILRYFGRRLPRWMTSTAVPNLRILTMIDLPFCTELQDGLCQLPYMEFLQIDRAPSIKHIGPCDPENLGSVVEFEVLESPELEGICNLPKLQSLCISMCPKIKELDGLSALEMLKLEDYDMNTLPGYLQDINLRHLLIYCDISLLTSIAQGKSSPEWDKFNHIQQVDAYADDANDKFPRKWYVSYTKDPFSFETNYISPTSGDGEEEQGSVLSALRRARKPLPPTRCLRRFPSGPEK